MTLQARLGELPSAALHLLVQRLGGSLTPITVACGALILLVRAPDPILHPAFLEEEIGGFWAPTFVSSPLDTLVTPWNGFLYVLPRTAFLVARLVPVDQAPVAAWAIHALALVMVAAFIASERMSQALPRRDVRVIAAIAIFLLPFARDYVYETVLDVGFFLAIYLAAVLVATPGTSHRWRLADALGVAIAALSGPASIVLSPLYVMRARRHPVLSAIVLAGAAAQAATLINSSRGLLAPDPTAAVILGLQRGLLAPYGDGLGVFTAAAFPAAVLLVAGLAVFASHALPRRTVLTLGYAAAAIAVAGVASNDVTRMVSPAGSVRYFLVAAWTLLVVGGAAFLAHRRSGLILVAIFVAGLSWTARVAPIVGPSWTCVGGSEPCTAGIVEWTGDSYRVPIGIWGSVWLYR